jgi:hypothetical protein
VRAALLLLYVYLFGSFDPVDGTRYSEITERTEKHAFLKTVSGKRTRFKIHVINLRGGLSIVALAIVGLPFLRLAYGCPLDRGVRQSSIKPWAVAPAAWQLFVAIRRRLVARE